MSAVIKASGNEVEPYWPMLFAKALKGQDVGALLSNIGSAGPAAGPAAAGGGDAAPAEEKKEVDPEIIAEKAAAEQFLAKREVQQKEDQAAESLEEVKKAEKKLKVAKLEADVEAFKKEEEKALGLVVEKIKEQKKITPLPMEPNPNIAKFEEGLKEMAKKEEIAE